MWSVGEPCEIFFGPHLQSCKLRSHNSMELICSDLYDNDLYAKHLKNLHDDMQV